MNWLMSTAILLPLALIALTQANVDNYGAYTLEWQNLDTCKGPKRADCGTILIESTSNISDIVFNMHFLNDCPVTKAKVTIGTFQESNNTVKKLWNYQLDKPCQHFVLGPILVKTFTLNNNCKIKKGHYEQHIDMEQTTKNFLGANFFYNTYDFKTMAFNNVHNFLCVHARLIVKKL